MRGHTKKEKNEGRMKKDKGQQRVDTRKEGMIGGTKIKERKWRIQTRKEDTRMEANS